MDVSRLNIQNRRNDNQQAPTPISNQVSNSFTFEIRKDCESISECSTALALPAQILPTQAPLSEALPMQAITIEANPIQVPSMQVPLTSAPLIGAPAAPPAPILAALMQAPPEQVPAHVQVPLEQVPLVHAPLTEVLSIPAPSVPIKDVSKVVIPEEFVSPNEVVTHKNLMLTHLPNKVLHHDMPELSTNRFAAYHPHYKEIPGMTEYAHNPSLLQPPPQLSSLPGDWSNCVVKFGTYHPHYKDKADGDPTRTFVCIANCFYFLCYWSNLSAGFFLTHNSGAYTAEPGLVTKKRESSRILSVFAIDTAMLSYSRFPRLYLSHHFQPPAFFFTSTLSEYVVMSKGQSSLMLSEMHLAIFKYLAMLKYAAIFKYAQTSKWQSSSTLASFSLLVDYSSVQLPSKASFNLSQITPKVEFLPDFINLLTKRLKWQITNKSCGLRYAKVDLQNTHLLLHTSYVICFVYSTNKANISHWSSIQCYQVTRGVHAANLYTMTYGLGIEKRHWGRYQIVRTKLYQHQHYGIDRTGKHEIC